MRAWKIIFIAIVSLAVLGVAGFFILNYLRPKAVGLMIDTSPESSVYVDGNYVGKTPYRTTREQSGEVTLKLVPVVTDQDLIPYTIKVTLVPGIETVIRREFGTSDETSSGDVISFEKAAGSGAGLIVISTPDNAQVSVDGVPRGFAPYKTSTITAAQHTINVQVAGYIDRTMTIKTVDDYRLTVFAKLAKAPEPTPSPTPRPEINTFVEILDTPTKFLRVRSKAGSAGEEIAEIKPGDKYPYLETDEASGWYQIQYQEPAPGLPKGITGWVSNQYSKLATSSASVNSNSN